MRRIKIGNKVIGGVEPQEPLKQPTSEYKDDISRGKYKLIKRAEPNIATPDYVYDVMSIRDSAFPIVSTVTSGTDIRATNTIGPNFSRRQQKYIDE